MLTRKLRSLKITLNEKVVNEMVTYFHLKTSLDLFYRVGAGIIDNQKLKEFVSSRGNMFLNFFKKNIRREDTSQDVHREEITEKFDQLVFGKNEEKLDYKMANCCNPIPGDNVFGFVTVNEGIKVHKSNCPNAIQLQSNYSYRIMPAKWIDSTQQEFKASLIISGIDTIGLVNEVTKVISSNLHIDMKQVHFDSDGGVFTGKVVVIVKNKTILNNLIENIKKINGIDKVTRL